MIAVTGAAGFIGSNLAHRLSGTGKELLLVDHPLTGGKMANWTGLKRFRFVQHDLFPEWLERESPAIEAVFHLGACSSTTETDWNFLYENNVRYSQRLWDWCAQAARPFLYASSAATYGDGSNGFDDRTTPARLRPMNAYGRSKNEFDLWAQARDAAGAAPPRWAGFKFFNVYGPREAHKGSMASMVWHSWRQIRENGEVRLFRSTHPDYPDGGQRRDFVYVEDCIDHMLWMWQGGAESGVYNSGTGAARTFLDLAHAVFAALGRQPDIRFIDMPASLAAQYQNFTCADMTRFRSLGFDGCATLLEDGVREYVRRLQAA